jgi:hypothetical protein
MSKQFGFWRRALVPLRSCSRRRTPMQLPLPPPPRTQPHAPREETAGKATPLCALSSRLLRAIEAARRRALLGLIAAVVATVGTVKRGLGRCEPRPRLSEHPHRGPPLLATRAPTRCPLGRTRSRPRRNEHRDNQGCLWLLTLEVFFIAICLVYPSSS